MAIIIDKRKVGKNKSVENRQRFIKRYKNTIKQAVHQANKKDAFKDIKGKKKITISRDGIDEPSFSVNRETGHHDRVLPGNDRFKPGERINKPQKGGGQGNQGSNSGEGEDDFTFVLTKEEFFNLYFEDMALPDFIKLSLKDNKKYKMKRSGYSKDGIPPRLDLLKTFKQAISRRIATRTPDFEPRYLDDIDIRYKHFVKKPIPIRTAHVFFLMDVSVSMDRMKKDLSKKCFLLLYLFLTRTYEKVEITFVRHTHEANICTEDEFFYGKQSGGTQISTGLDIINQYINDNIDLHTTNIYVAQSSDGENYGYDDQIAVSILHSLLPKVQYMVYIQVEDPEYYAFRQNNKISDVYDLYKTLQEQYKHLNIQQVFNEEDIFPVLRNLFPKEGHNND